MVDADFVAAGDKACIHHYLKWAACGDKACIHHLPEAGDSEYDPRYADIFAAKPSSTTT